MTSTFSPNLRIELIGAGEQAGAWNNTTNTNLGTLIESAIAGRVALASPSSPVTLTALYGTADQSRNMILDFTSLASDTVVNAPAVSKMYIVQNQSATYKVTIQVTGGGGTSVDIPALSRAVVFTDGTNFYNAVKELASGASIAGATIVTTTGSQTLTNKTLTAPKFADGGFLADSNGNEMIILDSNTSAVNEITVANAATGNSPSISATGGDTNLNLLLAAKGTGVVKAGGVEVATVTGSQTLTNKTLTAPKFADLGFIADANGNELIVMDTVTSAVNQLQVANSATGTAVTVSATGDDTNVSLNLVPKGSGTLQYNGTQIATTADIPSFTTSTQNAQTGTSYTLVLTDAGKTVTMSNASANTLTIPTNASVAFPVGTRLDVLQLGAGQTSIVGDTGVTVNKYNIASGTTAKIAGQYAAATLWKQATNTWYLVGNLTT